MDKNTTANNKIPSQIPFLARIQRQPLAVISLFVVF